MTTSKPDAHVLPPVEVDGPHRGQHLVPADKSFIRCTCTHPAFRDAPGVASWTCACPVGPRGCHGPRQVADADGTPQLVFGPFTLRTFGPFG